MRREQQRGLPALIFVMPSLISAAFPRRHILALLAMAMATSSSALCRAQVSLDCSDPFLSRTSACQQSSGSSGAAGANASTSGGQTERQTTSIPLPDVSSTVQRQNGNAQVYIDAAGNRWDRTTADNDRNQLALPPDPITDLQKLTRSATGESLSVFGRDLFQRAPSTFAPADQIPAVADYIVGPGDEILVRLFGTEAASSNSQLTVDASGSIYVPRVGSVQVAGLRADQLQARISEAVNHVFREYRIAVSLGHLRSIQVYVVGEARRPGAYTISALSSMLNALLVSGGPSVQGSLRKIQLRHADGTTTEFDLYDLILRGDKTQDRRLQSGDTIFVPPVGPQVALAGSVRHPAIYELKESVGGQPATSLQDVLKLAGGIAATGNPNQIRLERIGDDLQRHAVTVALDASGRATLLRDGDVVYANHIAAGYVQSVTIRGNLANPGRFAWKSGMKLSDILPDRNALLTNEYWSERNRMGVPVPLFEPSEYNVLDFDTQQQLARYGVAGQTPTSRQAGTINQYRNQSQDDRSLNSSRDALSSVQPASEEGQDQNVALAGGGVVSSGAFELDQQARNGTANAGIFGNNNGNNVPNSVSQQTQLDGNNTSRMVYGNGPQMAPTQNIPANRIRIPAPEIDWSYAVIERLNPETLKTSLLPFNLGRLVQDHDPTQNLALQPGDVVTILSQRDILVPQQEQTKYVRLEGEFASAGVYSVGPSETLDQLIRRAGGFTSAAYLYGSSFQRESARVFQQQRLDEYITRLSTDMERETAVRGASTPSGVSDPNALSLERNIIAQLRRLRATGRIVMEFEPNSIGVDVVPHISLENGDVFRVPSRPGSVSVIGAVYGQNVFLYSPTRHLADYVALAGKPNRIADKDHAFIIRADGSIFSRERAKGVLSNHFNDSVINPGDAIVVPEKLIKPTGLRQLLDYSQVLSSFGLAAAAINVIR